MRGGPHLPFFCLSRLRFCSLLPPYRRFRCLGLFPERQAHEDVFMNDSNDMDDFDRFMAIIRASEEKAREFLENIFNNQEIADKFFAIEQKILTIDNFKGLLEELLLLIEDLFALPFVWIAMVSDSVLADLLEAAESSVVLQRRLKLVTPDTLHELLGEQAEPFLANDQLKRFSGILPEKQHYLIRSLAMLPLTLHGKLVGSLNLADSDPSRYQPDMDTSFQSQLAVKVSICLANVIAQEKLRRLATHDPLTDLPNRREMDVVLQQELTRASRYNQSLALIFVDCDNFKQVNDRYGHDCGDALLHHVALRMRQTLRTTDKVFRFAGDEFVIILPHLSLQEAELAATRLRATVHAQPLEYQGNSVPLDISCGVASIADLEDLDANAFLKVADSRLYEAKARKTPQ
ncbi:MAG TPA: GGDEF domain-containing protein [Syntrophobacteraceae bacterium]|nr:GGDEF domain-containing protein [Syntrophobacteraceae bacterium]